jgi:hypothetical protein
VRFLGGPVAAFAAVDRAIGPSEAQQSSGAMRRCGVRRSALVTSIAFGGGGGAKARHPQREGVVTCFLVFPWAG